MVDPIFEELKCFSFYSKGLLGLSESTERNRLKQLEIERTETKQRKGHEFIFICDANSDRVPGSSCQFLKST